MVKFYCNLCDSEVTEELQEFQMEITANERIIDLTTGQPRSSKQVWHVCKKCYKDKFSLLNKKNGNIK